MTAPLTPRGPDFLRAAEDEAFRAGLRDWLARELPPLAAENRARAQSKDGQNPGGFRLEWETHLCQAGLSGLGWPREAGGHALSLTRQAIFHEEAARAGAPLGVNLIAHGIVAPTLIAFGTPEQKARYLPRILDNSEIWCQGYSEPGAGSDLAGLSLKAVREGSDYILNGQKIWTSFAHLSQHCLLLARTGQGSSPRHGISVLLVDMRLPGITTRPIRQITGEADFNEIFFDNVRVPVSALLGAENDGWRLAMAAANYERSTYFVPRVVRLQEEFDGLIRFAAEKTRGSRPAIEDPAIRQRLTGLGLSIHALRHFADHILAEAETGEASGTDSSAIKLLWSETHQKLLDLALEIMGPEALLGPQEASSPAEGRWTRDYLWTRAETILAGTSEIHRNIIAERGLGLPR